MATTGFGLSKAQKIRKRELRKASNALHEEVKRLREENSLHVRIPGLRDAIRIISEMRKRIDEEMR